MKQWDRERTLFNLGHYPYIYLKEVRATTQNVSLYSLCPNENWKKHIKTKIRNVKALKQFVPVNYEEI